MEKPVLFIDFDRTLFDTSRLREWLGDDIEARIQAIVRGTLELPDCTSMLYSDTIPFLEQVRGTHQLVLLTCTTYPVFQKKKVYSSGITPYFDEILITDSVEGNSGKGTAAKEYLHNRKGIGHIFIDDLPENISEVKMHNPSIYCIQIERLKHAKDPVSAAGLLLPDGKVANFDEFLTLFPSFATSQ